MREWYEYSRFRTGTVSLNNQFSATVRAAYNMLDLIERHICIPVFVLAFAL